MHACPVTCAYLQTVESHYRTNGEPQELYTNVYAQLQAAQELAACSGGSESVHRRRAFLCLEAIYYIYFIPQTDYFDHRFIPFLFKELKFDQSWLGLIKFKNVLREVKDGLSAIGFESSILGRSQSESGNMFRRRYQSNERARDHMMLALELIDLMQDGNDAIRSTLRGRNLERLAHVGVHLATAGELVNSTFGRRYYLASTLLEITEERGIRGWEL